MTLNECKTNKIYIIDAIDANNENNFKKICSLGLLPGIEIAIVKTKPLIVFRLSNTLFAIDKYLARHIYVKEINT
ncbi:MAG: FeoA family protein [Deferribacterota bacterium]|nr:FeoA family protein [Deferribacterota bacterium]